MRTAVLSRKNSVLYVFLGCSDDAGGHVGLDGVCVHRTQSRCMLLDGHPPDRTSAGTRARLQATIVSRREQYAFPAVVSTNEQGRRRESASRHTAGRGGTPRTCAKRHPVSGDTHRAYSPIAGPTRSSRLDILSEVWRRACEQNRDLFCGEI